MYSYWHILLRGQVALIIITYREINMLFIIELFCIVCWKWRYSYLTIKKIPSLIHFAQSAGAVEYTDCFSAEG